MLAADPLQLLLDAVQEIDTSSLPDRLELLTEKQRFVVEMNSGLRDGTEYSFEDIGEFMGISRVSVYQIYTRALRTMGREEGLGG